MIHLMAYNMTFPYGLYNIKHIKLIYRYDINDIIGPFKRVILTPMNNPVPIIPPRDIMDVCNDVNSRLVFA